MDGLEERELDDHPKIMDTEITTLLRPHLDRQQAVPLDEIVETILAQHPNIAGDDAAWYRLVAAHYLLDRVPALIQQDLIAHHVDELDRYRRAKLGR